MTTEECPLCLTRGTRRQRDGVFITGKTARRLACPACNGNGTIPRRRLQAIVRRGIEAGTREGRSK